MQLRFTSKPIRYNLVHALHHNDVFCIKYSLNILDLMHSNVVHAIKNLTWFSNCSFSTLRSSVSSQMNSFLKFDFGKIYAHYTEIGY